MVEQKDSGQKKKEILPSGFFAFRTGLLPFQEFLDWAGQLQSATLWKQEGEEFKETFEAERKQLQEKLRQLLERKEIREAVFIASPNLDEGLQRWLREPESEKGKRAEEALVRYFARMSGRSTPFGLFAGTSVGKVASATQIQIPPLQEYRRHTRLDMDYLYALAQSLPQDSAIRASLRFRPNSSLYKTAGRYRYAESRLAGKSRSYHLVALESTPYLEDTLQRAQKGASLQDLASALVDQEIAREEAEEYIQQLVESQILLPELAPAVTGAEPIHGMIEILVQNPAGLGVAAVLGEAQKAIASIDSTKLGEDQSRYREIAKTLEALPVKVELSRLFQIDMVKPSSEATLGENVIEEILKGVGYLQLSQEYPRQDSLSRFAEMFFARYESREIPLVEALDEESGIGFDRSNAPSAEASPLLEGIVFPNFVDGGGSWSRKEAFLLQKLIDAEKQGLSEIVLEERELGNLYANNIRNLPDAFAVMGVLSAPSSEAVEKGDFQVFLSSCGGPSGANLLGRFCHGDPKLTKEVLTHIQAEEALEPDGIFAEVVHLPEGRVGNVLLRPKLRKYEIPFLGVSGVDEQHQIPITDLMVSVLQGRVILRSKKLGKRIFPRLTTAHGYFTSRNLGLYRFLGALQHQGIGGGFGWNWGSLGNRPHLPRLRVGKVVLDRARWKMTGKEIESLLKGSLAEQYRMMQKWREERKIPRVVKLADYDNELPVDLENPLSLESFLQEIKGRGQAELVEMFPDSENMIASGPEGRFVSEIVVPFVRNREASPKLEFKHLVQTPRAKRSFAPGSEWLYAKLYTGTATADQLLRNVVKPVVKEALESGAADEWFFIRYSDPDWHLRLRLHGNPQHLAGQVLPRLQELARPLLEDGQLHKLQLDTYEREVERYGGEAGIVLAEMFFQADSEFVLGLVELSTGDELAQARWQLGLLGVDFLFSDFGLTLEEKHKTIETIRNASSREFRADDSYLKHMLGQKFRKEKKELEVLLNPASWNAHPFYPGIELLQQRSKRMESVIAELKRAESEKRLTVSIQDLLSSYIHMNLNRVLRSSQRAQELVIYDFLERLYSSAIAKQKSRKPSVQNAV